MTAPTRPSTAQGWAPPWTDTPEEIAARRAVLEEAHESHRWRAHRARKAADAEWESAIRDGLRELGAAA